MPRWRVQAKARGQRKHTRGAAPLNGSAQGGGARAKNSNAAEGWLGGANRYSSPSSESVTVIVIAIVCWS